MAAVYVWPLTHGPLDDKGGHGALHSCFSVVLPLAPNADAPQIRVVRRPGEAYERWAREVQR